MAVWNSDGYSMTAVVVEVNTVTGYEVKSFSGATLIHPGLAYRKQMPIHNESYIKYGRYILLMDRQSRNRLSKPGFMSLFSKDQGIELRELSKAQRLVSPGNEPKACMKNLIAE